MLQKLFCILLLTTCTDLAVHADEDWDLTAAERRKCAPLLIRNRFLDIRVMVPRDASFRGNQISVAGQPWVSVAQNAQASPKQAADFARRTNLRVVVVEEDVVVVDAGRQGYYFYLHFENGSQHCVFFQTDIASKEECLFRIRCLKTAKPATQQQGVSSVGNPALAGKPVGTAPRINRRWKDRTGNVLEGRLLAANRRQAIIMNADGEPVNVTIPDLDRDSSLICLNVSTLFALEKVLTHRAQFPKQRDTERGAEFSKANQILTGQHLVLRYRVTAVADHFDPAVMTSRQRQYRLSLRPLYHFEPALHEGLSAEIAYLKECFVPASRFALAEIDPERTTIEFTGRKAFDSNGADFVPHIKLSYGAGQEATFGFEPNGFRIYVVDSDSPVENALHQTLPADPPAGWKPLPHPDSKGAETKVVMAEKAPASNMPKAEPNSRTVRRSGKAAVRNRAANTNSGNPGQNVEGKRIGHVRTSAGRKSLAGSNRIATIACAKGRVSIAGNDNEITITGVCTELSLAGSRNRIHLQDVRKIVMAGQDNEITYEGARPEVRGPLSRNHVEQSRE